jgi:hypothetical protein
MAPPSCTFNSPIPNPQTSLPACSVPIGFSNSTILDTCCNSEVNPIRSYGAPDGGPSCYQYCTTDDVQAVEQCLQQNLGAYEVGQPQFQCFNVAVGVKKAENGGARIGGGRWVFVLMTAGFVWGLL